MDEKLDAPTPPARSANVAPGRNLGWILLMLLITAVNVAIALAVHTDASATACNGQYTQCCNGYERSGMCVERCDLRYGYVNGCNDICDGWDDNWGRCEPECVITQRNTWCDDVCDGWPAPDWRDDPSQGQGLFDDQGLFDSEPEFSQPQPFPADC